NPSAFAVCLAGLGLAGGAPALAQQYTISTIAGGAPPATPVPATSAAIGPPQRVAVDAGGNVYFSSSNSVFKIDAKGLLTRIAGNSRAGFSGDGGPAVQAQLNSPEGVAIDGSGDVFIADTGNNRVREVTPDGNINTVAGTGVPGWEGDGGPANQALLHAPMGVAVDANGNLYIADTANASIREVTTDGNINTFAGVGYAAFTGDGGPANSAQLNQPQDVTVAPNGAIFIADTGNGHIRMVTSDGNINSVAGNGGVGYAGDGSVATSAELGVPMAVAADSAGNYYLAEFQNNRIRKVDSKGNISTIVGNGNLGFSGDGAAATSASLNQPTGVAVDGSGNLYIADQWNLRIRKVDSSGNITTIAGSGVLSYSGDGGPAANAQLSTPQGGAVDRAGNLYIADSRNGAIRQVSTAGTINTIATLGLPLGVAVASGGNVYVSDFAGNTVRMIAPDGTVTTVAGTGNADTAGDGGPAANADINGPFGLALDSAGNLYIAEFSGNRIRKVGTDGTISTVAGSGIQSYFGDGGPATQAALNGPFGVAVDAGGNLYIADTNNSAIREVTPDGTIQTIAGTGLAGYSGDGGPAANAQMINPKAIAVDGSGNLYVADSTNRIRKFQPGGTITTIAGNGTLGYSGDGGPATAAQISAPSALSIDGAGDVFVVDSGNNAVRVLKPGK
ncbi:MAG TPA: NHL repeat-containing protein, partial [Bryobacteraceae bacterium]|nr:NHL repeat-containing protein [Bryobacteraceae bacterium]